MAKNVEIDSQSINTIGAGTVIKGDIKSSGNFRIDGTLIGSIDCKGKIIVGNTGIVEGEIYCQNADFSGEIRANVKVSELMALKASSKLAGDIITNKLSIEPGAKFSGSCNMDSNLPGDPGTKTKDEANKAKEEAVK
ncbi:MAG: polymer-forming cytoskeletal protein [Bacteroidales bacterium]|nr:polymer-forming cytoskeletal protein [Bacteroidales bacterium]